MVKALIFDFDGVIILSEQARFHMLQKIANSYGVEIADKLSRNILGRTATDFLRKTLSDDEKVSQKILQDYQHEKGKLVDHVTPIEPIIEFIRTYNGTKRLAIASNNGYAIIEKVLGKFGILEKFNCIVGKEQVTKHKPDPEIYTLTAKQLGYPAQECIVIEDTVVGAQAALHAGMSVYIYLNGYNSRSEFEGIHVTDFLETTEQIRRKLA